MRIGDRKGEFFFDGIEYFILIIQNIGSEIVIREYVLDG